VTRAVRIGSLALAGLVVVKAVSVVPGVDAVFPGLVRAFGLAATAAESAPETAAPAGAQAAPPVAILPELLADIAAEHEALAARKAALDLRAAEIDLARAAVLKQTEELTRLREQVAQLVETAKGAETADVTRLVKIYEAMKPAEAAAILQGSDLELAVLVITAMAERNAGPIMAAMAADRANAISRVMLERSRLPGDQQPVVVQLN
jgi:flagellar motility protein MotE (MotC chaperone)